MDSVLQLGPLVLPWGCLICWLLVLLPKLLLLRTGMRLAPDASGLGPFTELE